MLPPSAAAPQPTHLPAAQIPALRAAPAPQAAHPATAPAQHVPHPAKQLPPWPSENSAPPAPKARTQPPLTPNPPAQPVPQPAHCAQPQPPHPPREPLPAPLPPATRCSWEPWRNAPQPALRPQPPAPKPHADFPFRHCRSNPSHPADHPALCGAPPDAGSLPASTQGYPLRMHSIADQLGRMNPAEDSTICSKPDSLLSQHLGCGLWPEAALANLGVRTSLAPKRKSRREKRLRQTNTCRSERRPRGVRNRLFFAARAARSASY